ncbi:MAG: glycoside hydrolase family 5 protein [Dermatophilaceae bacterium]
MTRRTTRHRRLLAAIASGVLALGVGALAVTAGPATAAPTTAAPSSGSLAATADEDGEPVKATDGTYPQFFRADGNDIVREEDGTEVIFRGVSGIDIASWAWVQPQEWNEATFAEMARWGINTVRLPIIDHRFRERGDEAGFALIDQALDWAEQHRMYVILDYHGIGDPEADQAEADRVRAFWGQAAQRYADEPRIMGYELYNEPTGWGDWDADWGRHKDFIETVVDIVRQHDTKHPVMVGATDYAYQSEPVLANPVSDPNTVYTTHPYPNKRDWEGQIGAVKDRYPMFATEIGFCTQPPESTSCVDNWQESAWEDPSPGAYGNQIVQYLEDNDVSWTVWAWDESWAPPLLTCESDCGYQTTAQGTLFKAKLQELNGVTQPAAPETTAGRALVGGSF